MRLLNDHYFIEADYEDTYRLKGTTLKLWVDPDFNKYEHAVQCGIVHSLPMRVSKRRRLPNGDWTGFYDHTPLKVGDKVYFHHLVVDPRQEYKTDGKKVYLAHHRDIYAVVRDGKILILEDWVFSEKITEAEENYQKKIGDVVLYLKPEPAKIERQLRVMLVSPVAREHGLEPGMVIHHSKNADYEMLIEDRKLYRTKLRFVDCIMEPSEESAV